MLEDLQRKRYHVAILSWTSLFREAPSGNSYRALEKSDSVIS